MNKEESLAYVKKILAIKAVVFFEVRVLDGEDVVDLAKQIAGLGCTAIVDLEKRVVKVFSAHSMPKGFGYV